MRDVKDDKVQDIRTGLNLIFVEDGSDAAQCREEVSHEESREVEQGSKEEAEGHGPPACHSARRGRVPQKAKGQKPTTDAGPASTHPRFDFAKRFSNAEERLPTQQDDIIYPTIPPLLLQQEQINLGVRPFPRQNNAIKKYFRLSCYVRFATPIILPKCVS